MPRKTRFSTRKSSQHLGGQRYKKYANQRKRASLENTSNDNHDMDSSSYQSTIHSNVNDNDTLSSSTTPFINQFNVIIQDDNTSISSSTNTVEQQSTSSDTHMSQLEPIYLGSALNAHQALPSLPNNQTTDFREILNSSITTNSNTNHHYMQNRSYSND